MSPIRRRIFVVATLACLLLAMLAVAKPGSARNLTPIHLYGSRAAGWGFTNTTLTIPGPPLEFEVGDNVTLNLTSVDGRTHRWFIDYDNDSAADASEPRSPDFGTDVDWNFTVSNVTGTYTYRSDRAAGPGDDLTNMWGNITIRPAGTTPPGGFGGTNLFLIAGMVAAFVAILAIAVLAYRRPRKQPPPPPPE